MLLLVLSQILGSCHTSRKTAATKPPQPRFINQVSIAPHNKAAVTHNAIDHKKYPKAAGATASTGGNSTHIAAGAAPAVAAHEPANTPVAIRKKYAEILGVKPKEINNYPLYQFIEKWYGTNYRLGGQDNTGIDCSGFAQKLYSDVFGIDLSRTSGEQFSDCLCVKPSAAHEGDLVFFHIHSKRITHVGVYLTNDFFVHSSTTGGVMISSLNEEYWHKYFAGCGRVPRG